MVQKMSVSLMFYISITGCEYMALSVVIVVFNTLLLLHNGKMVCLSNCSLYCCLCPQGDGSLIVCAI